MFEFLAKLIGSSLNVASKAGKFTYEAGLGTTKWSLNTAPHWAMGISENVPRALGSMARRAEGAFVKSINLLTGAMPFRGARTGDEAIERLFPWIHSNMIHDVKKGELEGLLSEDFLKSNKHRITNIRKEGVSINGLDKYALVTNAKDAASADKLREFSVMHDFRRFSPNTKIPWIIAGGIAGGSLMVSLPDSLRIPTQDPSVYYDGVNMRNVNDLGADASYGRAVMYGGRR